MLPNLAKQYSFTQEEIIMLKNRFDRLCDRGMMTKQQFRDSLGILGLEQFLAERIFNQIDGNKDGVIMFEDFVKYLSMLLNGSTIDKALWSFGMLSNNKSILELEDMEKMIFEICYLWNSITGSKSMPKKELVSEIFRIFDNDDDGIVQFEEFRVVYQEGVELIGWYEFLNNEDMSTNKIKEEWENVTKNKSRKKRMTLINRQLDEQTPQDLLNNQLKILQSELQGCSELIKYEKEKEQQQKQINFLASFYFDDKSQKTHGPIFNDGQVQKLYGDDDPDQNDEPYFKQYNMASTINNDRFQNNIMNRLRNLLKLTEDIKKLNSQQIVPKLPEQSVVKQFKKSSRSPSPISVNQTIDDIQQQQQQENVRKNLSIYFGHENWNLVLNMMIGIRKAIKSLHPLTDDILITAAHFEVKNQFEIIPKRTQKSCSFYEYSPLIFERIRKMYGISNDDFLRSIGPEQLLGDLIFGNLASLTEKVSSGKSGSFFYYSFDDKYMLKTIQKDEFVFFKSLIKNYYQHLLDNYHSMIIKIFGLYQIKVNKSKTKYQKIYFVVMLNIFYTNEDINYRYDLKGSLYQRTSRVKGQTSLDQNIPLKDLDWLEDKQSIQFDQKTLELFKTQLIKDVNFFKQNKIIDYSFLIGIVDNYRMNNDNVQTQCRFYERWNGGCITRDQKRLYYFGIIDIFTEYNNKKQLEHKVKSTFVSKDVSCIPPESYADRFIKFILHSLK
ncbi:unnamed protein product [Paramecium pentaurelia]|uniref:Phosphatidylinositol-4-phosphate 5-kinase n=1 Tax=Paramecium pentaurelia TaxID=43138 RepID=A0A8S1TJ65_9CILI|nr:unnamed protein product [Paramecium pentaurelia]